MYKTVIPKRSIQGGTWVGIISEFLPQLMSQQHTNRILVISFWIKYILLYSA